MGEGVEEIGEESERKPTKLLSLYFLPAVGPPGDVLKSRSEILYIWYYV